ncbi:hypothetical protein C8J57DRAFT_1251834 [Mycena rebaudengoi]|nr:hypothetical protein C8J57DRAFT_1251834 [Mycena rebaudengoi]
MSVANMVDLVSVTSLMLNDLPFEILGEALVLGFGSFFEDPEGYAKNRIAIRTVCRLWDHLVTSNPAAWNHIHVQNKTPVAVLRAHTARSKSLPFIWHFHLLPKAPGLFPYNIFCPNWEHLLSVLAPLSSRCIVLIVQSDDMLATFFIMGRLSNMDGSSITDLSLEIKPGPIEEQRHDVEPLSLPFMGSMPALSSLTFDGSFVLWNPTLLYSTLHTLHLEGLSHDDTAEVDDYFNLFTTAVRLVDLHLVYVECNGFRTFSIQPPTLPYLTRLYFATDDDTSCCLLSMLKLPALCTLHLEITKDADISTFISHCSRTVAGVETLLLNVQVETLPRLVGLLLMMPAIRCIDVIDPSVFASLALHTALLGWNKLCPRLYILRLNEYIPRTMLRALLLSRTSPFTPSGRGLRIMSPSNLESPGITYVLYEHNGSLREEVVAGFKDYYYDSTY